MNKKSLPLNIFNFNFNETALIEASAGTGKTLTIVILYLRAILQLTKNENIKKQISIQNILIVTFTNVAKEEIKNRIKEYISHLKIAFKKKTTTIDILKPFLHEIKTIKHAIKLLETAENNIDTLSIYTIHGFCKMILSNHCINSNLNTQPISIEDENFLYLKATTIFWNQICNILPYHISKLIFQHWSTSEKLFKDIFSLLKIPLEIVHTNIPKNHNIKKYHYNLILKISNFKRRWLKNFHKINLYLNTIKINRRIYHHKNITRWINNINAWAQKETIDYLYPKELHYFNFIEKYLTKNIFNIPHIFKIIKHFLKKKFCIKEIIILKALHVIPKIIQKEKSIFHCHEFNDLTTWLNNTLKNKKIIKEIQIKYPIAFIDEFQDTDLQQYEIFKKIYNNNKKCSLILVGDPKQAIYNFRGADIFTYFKAKSEIMFHYHLNKNFRASKHMNDSINRLFSKTNKPFIFSQITFQPTISHKKKMQWFINGKLQSSLNFIIEPIKNINNNNWVATQCANYMQKWIQFSKKKTSIIKLDHTIRPTNNSDIVVLVRNKYEGELIQDVLNKKNIKAIYISNKKSIYHTKEAYELFLILISIIDLNNEQALNNTFLTNFITKTTMDIKKIHKCYIYRSQYKKKLSNLMFIWCKYGIYELVNQLIENYKNNTINSLLNEHQSIINNLRHLGDLLQIQEIHQDNKYNFVQWIKNKINDKNRIIPQTEYIKHNTNKDYIKIINIHSSKGLEFPIVVIPFVMNYIQYKYLIFHNKNHKLSLDLTYNSYNIKQSIKERLSEEIRLLYVAITRSTIHCSIGIQTSNIQTNQKNNLNNVYNNTIAYLLGSKKKSNKEEFIKTLSDWNQTTNKETSIKNRFIIYTEKTYSQNNYYVNIEKKLNLGIPYSTTSFTRIQSEIINTKINDKNIPILFYKKIKNTFNNVQYNPHNFIKGSTSGILLHEILKKTNFEKNIQEDMLLNILKLYHINKKYLPMLSNWVFKILNTPLNKDKFSLSQLKPKQYIKELEFILPIKNILKSRVFSNISIKLDNISKLLPQLNFKNKKGFITGFIDLIFEWNQKYYILDYKSNWLGINNQNYTIENINKIIMDYRYDIQYQIYSIALHRYLKNKINNYTYSKHFGGVFYFFIRAADELDKNNGVFYKYNSKKLIHTLNNII
ncbi:MAG: exodeoxyribonuclease V subunit beta [Buchnera aphidicola (Eriosoma harunire)]